MSPYDGLMFPSAVGFLTGHFEGEHKLQITFQSPSTSANLRQISNINALFLWKFMRITLMIHDCQAFTPHENHPAPLQRPWLLARIAIAVAESPEIVAWLLPFGCGISPHQSTTDWWGVLRYHLPWWACRLKCMIVLPMSNMLCPAFQDLLKNLNNLEPLKAPFQGQLPQWGQCSRYITSQFCSFWLCRILSTSQKEKSKNPDSASPHAIPNKIAAQLTQSVEHTPGGWTDGWLMHPPHRCGNWIDCISLKTW